MDSNIRCSPRCDFQPKIPIMQRQAPACQSAARLLHIPNRSLASAPKRASYLKHWVHCALVVDWSVLVTVQLVMLRMNMDSKIESIPRNHWSRLELSPAVFNAASAWELRFKGKLQGLRKVGECVTRRSGPSPNGPESPLRVN
jgi:hypothetical protein